MPAPIAAISLDLDDTLWPMRPVLLHAESVLSSWLRDNAPMTSALMASPWRQSQRRTLRESHPEHAHDVGWLRQRLLTDALRESGEPVELAKPAYDLFLEARQAVSLYDDVIPVLEAWSPRFKLIAITNGNADLNRIGLGHLFDVMLGAHQVGMAKPDPRIFLSACQAANVSPEQVLHVGDDWHRDIHGARQAGLQAAWLRRADLGDPDGPAHEPAFATLSEIAGHLDQNGAATS